MDLTRAFQAILVGKASSNSGTEGRSRLDKIDLMWEDKPLVE